MENERIFIIDNKILLLDKVLVEFNGTPIFFVCKSGEEYYIALYVEGDVDHYFVTPITLMQLSKMLCGKITMRNLILQSKVYWDVLAGASMDEDIVGLNNTENIPLETLPYEDAYFEIATEELKEYVKTIDEKLYMEAFWDFIREERLEKEGYFVGSAFGNAIEAMVEEVLTNKNQKVECEEVFETSKFTLIEKQKDVSFGIDNKMTFAA